ncbi:hypothetical protein MHAE_18332 [Mycobacterium haemophilum DSM 44634]|uniref:Uncharacterized protein n=1 Tax=Mycobacterium haemophilum TaxID=29311 RepID=A0A0I9Y5D5_9MYCO|nr:hypothetical protein B586_13445 [Mycobacterium haemophilum DSM 44634]KLO26856.1 hypothetical protein ABH39_16840 [Mycobacterium haemophilum]KLO34862.1 hypothetical protein ABH38_17565 [Mycobacterium haemophilum]KLO39844.1 hypothetical protein ABH37_17385 [Mycobacterium haemophilum]KLO46884.1 hypothetical protein ABH36_17495 [Mycobacterium haemophilum]
MAQTRDESILRGYVLLTVAPCLWRLGQVRRAETLLRQTLQLFQPIKYIYGCKVVWSSGAVLLLISWDAH